MRAGIGVCVAAMALLGGAAAPAEATTCVWTGGGFNGSWGWSANWSGCGGHAPQNGDSLSFPDGASRPANNNDIANLTIASITVQGTGSSSQRWVITGHALTVTSGITLSGGDAMGVGPSFHIPITLGGPVVTLRNETASLIFGTAEVGDIDLNGGKELLVDGASGSIVAAGVISGSGSVVKTGINTLWMRGANTYAGPTWINLGWIALDNAQGLGATGAGNETDVFSGATLAITTPGLTIAESLYVAGSGNGASGALDVNPLTLPGFAATWAGQITVTAGTTFLLEQASKVTVTGPIHGSGQALVVQGEGATLTLTNPGNAWSGLTLANTTLLLGAAGVIPDLALLDLGSGVLDLNGVDETVGPLAGGSATSAIRLGANTLTLNQASNGTYNGVITGTGALVKNGAGNLALGGAASNTYAGMTTVNGGGLSLLKTNGLDAIAGPIVVNGGTLQWYAGNQVPDTTPITVNAPGVLDLNGQSETIGSLAGSGRVLVNPGRLRIGGDNTSTTFTGVFEGSGDSATHIGVEKIGAGTLTLTGVHPLTASVVVAGEGALIVNGSLSTYVAVEGGATLGGTGRVGALEAFDGAVSPGMSPGVLHAASASLFSDNRFVVELNGLTPGAGHDQLDVAGDVHLFDLENLTARAASVRAVAVSAPASAAGLQVTRSFSPPMGQQFTIINVAAGKTVSGTFPGLPEGATFAVDGQRFSITYHGGDGNDVVLTVLEPAVKNYYLSEGATGSFFDEDVLIANPNSAAAPVTMTFFKEDGQQVTTTRTLPAQSHVTVHVDQIPGLEATAASARITSESNLPLVVERSMFWDARYYAGHTGSAVDEPAQDWFFGEGAQGFFDTFVLVINPNSTPADVTFTFLRENEPPVVKTLPVAASSRLTVPASAFSELKARSFGIMAQSTLPIMAERSMYFGTTPGRLWSGGHESAGVTAPAMHWFLAEGATSHFFDTFILLSNPQPSPAHVTMQYLLASGDPISVTKTIPANARLTVNIKDEADPRLHDAAVSTVVTADVPIVAERSMYWPTAVTPWGEAHNSFGVVDAATHWGLAEGRAGGTHHFHTFILLANPQTTDAEVTVSYLLDSGAPVARTYHVPASTRFTIDVNGIAELKDASFGADITVTNHIPIIVERSLYWDSDGVVWSGGTNATGIRLP